ncbi:hypothetical protein ACFQZC_35575 [Streptacidiphilus monticola]
MITELAVERVEFACGHCWHQWSVDFDVQQWRDEENGEEWEYFSRDGIPAASPTPPPERSPARPAGGTGSAGSSPGVPSRCRPGRSRPRVTRSWTRPSTAPSAAAHRCSARRRTPSPNSSGPRPGRVRADAATGRAQRPRGGQAPWRAWPLTTPPSRGPRGAGVGTAA